MYKIFLGLIVGFVVALVMGSFIEYAIHKYLLHSTPKIFKRSEYVKSMWKGHAVSHHGSYAPDEHYTRDDTNKQEVLTFSWYEGPLIIFAATAVVYGIATVFSLLAIIPSKSVLSVVIGASIVFTLYYIAYEGLHAIMHVPKKFVWLRKSKIMLWLNRRHYQHHRDPRTNLNVIFPLADYIWGTKKSLPKEQYVIADSID